MDDNANIEDLRKASEALMNEIEEALDTDIKKLDGADQIEEARNSVQEMMFELEQEIILIKGQIDEASHRPWRERKHIDPVWWRKINSALRFKGQMRLQLQTRLGELNRLLRAAAKRAPPPPRELRREQLFIQAAKENLKAETYKRLWQVVDDREGTKLE